MCWRPREPRSWLATEGATSWIPECEVCRKALSFRDGRDPVVSMVLDKQEETVRESRYFTALKAYKHGAPGRKSRSLSSERRLRCAGSREPGAGGAQLPGRSRAPRPGPSGEHDLEDGAPLAPSLQKQSPAPCERPAPSPCRCRERPRSGWGTAIPSASWGLWTKVTDSPSAAAASSSRPPPALPFCSCQGQRFRLLAEGVGRPRGDSGSAFRAHR